jgi:hypothetical protein
MLGFEAKEFLHQYDTKAVKPTVKTPNKASTIAPAQTKTAEPTAPVIISAPKTTNITNQNSSAGAGNARTPDNGVRRYQDSGGRGNYGYAR